MDTIEHKVDFCVVGGGMAGVCAAIAAARNGAKVAIVQDRPVFGGNASGEIRMWICGAHGPHRRETGIIEEIELENLYRNPNKVYPIWDALLIEKIKAEPNITAILNCPVNQAETTNGRILSVSGWQSTTQTQHTIEASLFADCSGDSVLAPLTGAAFRVGREARSEFNEDIEPQTADNRTMGMSCLIQVRELDHPVTFRPPPRARYYASPADLPHRDLDPFRTNFWWIELGGEDDSIRDTETIRDRLLAEVYGIWDLIKNRSGQPGVENLEIDFIGFLPGKRESRRYEGDHIINQNDVRAGGPFGDIVAYGGWSMDDHHPAGLAYPGEPTIFHEAPSPWGIPFRSLYSRNIENLLFAGRNISATHIALSSSRVMRTCAIIGQAAGTAAALCIRHNLAPRELGQQRIRELQQRLMDDDCWLPGLSRTLPDTARLGRWCACQGDPEPLASGIERPVESNPDDAALASRQPNRKSGSEKVAWTQHAWTAPVGASVSLLFDRPRTIQSIRLVFDSDLDRRYSDMRMRCHYLRNDHPMHVAPTLIKHFQVHYLKPDGQWQLLVEERENVLRLYRAAFDTISTTAIRLTTRESHGNDTVNVFAFDAD